MDGRTVLEGYSADEAATIDSSSIDSKGTYILILESESRTTASKIFID